MAWKVVSASDGQQIVRAPTVTVPQLIVDMGKGVMRVARFEQNVRWRIGRLPGNHLPLEFDDGVSGFHAVVIRELDLFRVEDPGPSRNGTYVNGQLVVTHRLQDRDVLTCGTTDILVRCPVLESGTGTAVVDRRPDWQVLSPMERAAVLALLDLWPAEKREIEVDKPDYEQLAKHMGITGSTVRKHFQNIYKKLAAYKIENRHHALATAAAADERLLRELAAADA